MGLSTRVNLLCDDASVTRDLTAPVELASTVLPLGDPSSPVASPTAEQLAPVHAVRRGVALPSLRSQRTRLVAVLTKVQRLVKVDEVVLLWRLDGGLRRHQGLAIVARNHLHCPVKLQL